MSGIGNGLFIREYLSRANTISVESRMEHLQTRPNTNTLPAAPPATRHPTPSHITLPGHTGSQSGTATTCLPLPLPFHSPPPSPLYYFPSFPPRAPSPSKYRKVQFSTSSFLHYFPSSLPRAPSPSNYRKVDFSTSSSHHYFPSFLTSTRTVATKMHFYSPPSSLHYSLPSFLFF